MERLFQIENKNKLNGFQEGLRVGSSLFDFDINLGVVPTQKFV